ncbi:MAG: hypothetical protein LBP67_02225 [Bacteroidales bacterium]|jgi:hypothetical protein|nr:hypothetical protein [Bacteroidales bacterium]
MKKRFSKLIILIGLIYLSTGAFSQNTSIIFETFPNIPKYTSICDIKATTTIIWHLSTGESIQRWIIVFSSSLPTFLPFPFPGTDQQYQQVTHTQVIVDFNDGVCGASNIFPGFKFTIICPDDLPATKWWYRDSDGIIY